MTEDRQYVCKECGEIFPDALSLGRHVHSHKKPKQGGGVIAPKAPILTEDQVKELQELEYQAKKTELEIRRARATAELRRFETTSEQPKEKTWILPDGTSFQGSSADYRDMLQTYYQTQAIMKKSASTEENPTVVKAMLERMTELEKTVSESKLKGLEDKLNYIVSRDPLGETETGYKKLAEAAAKLGFTQAGSDLPSKKFAMQESVINTGLRELTKKLDRTADRVDRLAENFSPFARKVAEGSLRKFSSEHPEYNIPADEPKVPEPISDQKIINLSKEFGDDGETLQEFSTFDLRKYLKDRLSPHSKHKTKTLNS